MAAFLGEIGGREIDRDALRRQRQPQGAQRRAHPLATFADCLVGQPDDGKADVAGGDHHLHVDRHHIDALECYRLYPCLHDHSCPDENNYRTMQEKVKHA